MEGRRHLIVSYTSVTSSKHIIAASKIYHISSYVAANVLLAAAWKVQI